MVKLREIQEGDIEACADLYAQVFSSDPWNENWDYSKAYERLLHFYHSKGFIGILAEDQGVICFVLGNSEPYLSGAFFYLREMCTKQSLQNQGVGKEVFQALESKLRSLGIENIYLLTQRSIPAARFYLKHGFIQSNEMGFYSKCINS